MVVHRQFVHAGAGKVVHHAIGRERHAERPPAKLLDPGPTDLAAVAAAANPDVAAVFLELAGMAALEADEHARPVFLEAVFTLVGMVVARDDGMGEAAGTEAKTRPGAILPLLERRHVHADGDAGAITD